MYTDSHSFQDIGSKIRTLGQALRRRHERRLADTIEARRGDADRPGVTQSEARCRRLQADADTPRGEFSKNLTVLRLSSLRDK